MKNLEIKDYGKAMSAFICYLDSSFIEALGVSSEEVAILIGHISVDEVERLLSRCESLKEVKCTYDQLERCSYLLKLHQAMNDSVPLGLATVKQIFSEPNQYKPFNGLSPKALLMKDQSTETLLATLRFFKGLCA